VPLYCAGRFHHMCAPHQVLNNDIFDHEILQDQQLDDMDNFQLFPCIDTSEITYLTK